MNTAIPFRTIRPLSFGVTILLLMPGLALARQGGPAPVAVVEIEETGEDAAASFVGTSAPIRQATIGSAVEGRVQNVFVDEGMFIEVPEAETQIEPDDDEGTHEWAKTDNRPPMVQIRTETLGILIRSAEASLQVSRLELELLKEALPIEVQQAELEVQTAEAAFNFAKANHKRQKDLLDSDSGAVSADLVESAFKEMIAAQSAHSNAEFRFDLLSKTLQAKIDQAEAKVDVEVEALNVLKDQQTKYTIRAPFSGFVVAQHAEMGDWIQKGDPVIELMQLDPIELRVNIPEDYVARLYAAMSERAADDEKLTVNIRFQALPNHEFEGHVERIVPQADLRTRSFPVLIHVANPDRGDRPMIRSGMLARVNLPIGRTEQRLMVPKDAVVLNGASYSVVVVDTLTDEQGKDKLVARTVPISVGVSIGSRIEIRGELRSGQLVVVEGNERIRTGQEVRIVQGRQ